MCGGGGCWFYIFGDAFDVPGDAARVIPNGSCMLLNGLALSVIQVEILRVAVVLELQDIIGTHTAPPPPQY